MRRVRASSAVALCVAICLPVAGASGQQATGTIYQYPAKKTSQVVASPTRDSANTAAVRVATRSGSRVLTPSGSRTTSYVPAHLRQDTAGGQATASSAPQPTLADQGSLGSGAVTMDQSIGAGVDEVIEGDWMQDGAMGCDECGVCETGCCPPRPPCWLDGFGGVLYNGEYFVGAEAHTGIGARNEQFQSFEECGFGYFGGANFGAPLHWLTCGLFSGQLGLSSVSSNLGGDPAGAVNNQLFVTGGFFRRVDYGLQGGVVADFMDANWHFDPRVVQVRGELSWAYPEGQVHGFRFTKGVQDYVDEQSPAFNRQALDTYRFFARCPIPCGGYSELMGGWTQDGQGLMGAEFEVPTKERLVLKSGFTYVFTDDGHDFDAWNIFVGVSFRPRGRAWYDDYHRPMFDVAHNGSLIQE